MYICIYFDVYTSFRYTRSTYTQMRQICSARRNENMTVDDTIESVRDLILKESAWVIRDAQRPAVNLSQNLQIFRIMQLIYFKIISQGLS